MDRNTTGLCCPLYQCGESWLDMWAMAGRGLGTSMCQGAPSQSPHLRSRASSTGSPQVMSAKV